VTQQEQSERTPFARTPNAERYLLESDNLRRRQLRSALMHGSAGVWRERRRIWPAVVAGIVAIAVVMAAIAVRNAFHSQREIAEQERLRRQPLPAATTPAPPFGTGGRRMRRSSDGR
jgi:hypothetical protein